MYTHPEIRQRHPQLIQLTGNQRLQLHPRIPNKNVTETAPSSPSTPKHPEAISQLDQDGSYGNHRRRLQILRGTPGIVDKGFAVGFVRV